MLMDFNCIEALLGLPEFRVINQIIGPRQLDLHLERRETYIVCPRCQTSCSRVKESRPRYLRGLAYSGASGHAVGASAAL